MKLKRLNLHSAWKLYKIVEPYIQENEINMLSEVLADNKAKSILDVFYSDCKIEDEDMQVHFILNAIDKTHFMDFVRLVAEISNG